MLVVFVVVVVGVFFVFVFGFFFFFLGGGVFFGRLLSMNLQLPMVLHLDNIKFWPSILHCIDSFSGRENNHTLDTKYH